MTRYKSHPGHTAKPAYDVFDANGFYPWEVSRAAYPLTAVCTCGQIITKASERAPWVHSSR